jgi:DNA invertase Pin-like site-specific DNA recombinase
VTLEDKLILEETLKAHRKFANNHFIPEDREQKIIRKLLDPSISLNSIVHEEHVSYTTLRRIIKDNNIRERLA